MTKFTPAELRALHDKDFFLIKASATKKIDALLASIRDEIKAEIIKNKIVFPEEVDVSTGKIFKGENYLGFPYLVLDYPKLFSKDSVFAFRTMFWWGNFFSCTLHLQGKALDEYRKRLTPALSDLAPPKRFAKARGEGVKNPLNGKNIYICVNKTPWQYHYKKENYILIDKFSESDLKQLFITKEFIKLSRKIPLKDFKKLSGFAKESFLMIRCTK